MLDLWVDKYRPNTLEGYVFKSKDMEDQVNEWVSNIGKKKIPFPNLLFTGPAGVGKTTLAYIIKNEFKIADADTLIINASRENNVDTIRDKVVNFCSTWPLGEYKLVLMDEADGLSAAAQKIMRAEIEKYSDVARFILTANYPQKIIPALHSRLQQFHFGELDQDGFYTRLIKILVDEEVDFDPDDLGAFGEKAYPDLRKAINLLDQHTRNGKLYPLTENSDSKDYLIDTFDLFKAGKYNEARRLVCSQANPEEYDDIYRFLYQNLDLFGEDDDKQSRAIIEIAKGIRDHAVVADPEINLAATMCRLKEVAES